MSVDVYLTKTITVGDCIDNGYEFHYAKVNLPWIGKNGTVIPFYMHEYDEKKRREGKIGDRDIELWKVKLTCDSESFCRDMKVGFIEDLDYYDSVGRERRPWSYEDIYNGMVIHWRDKEELDKNWDVWKKEWIKWSNFIDDKDVGIFETVEDARNFAKTDKEWVEQVEREKEEERKYAELHKDDRIVSSTNNNDNEDDLPF